MPRSSRGGVASVRRLGAALLDRCPRCCAETAIAPAYVTELPRSTTCVYECPACRHSWFTNYWTAALGALVGAEPVRIGDAL